MFEALTIQADHKDLIHDVTFDFYGERMATCSSDQYVKIWDTDGHGGWNLSSSWKAHHGSVWKVTWAHPEFGQVIATCSFDRTAAVWEEVGDTTLPGAERGVRQWVKRSNLVDSRTSVTDVKFGPKHLGLLLVTCSADGIIRIYEAPDVMNLAQWTLQHEIPTKVSVSSLSWNPSLSRVNPPMLAVGSDDPNMATTANATDKTSPTSNAKVFIYEYTENSRRWTRTECITSCVDPVNDLAFAPNLGRSFHLLAVATKDVRIIKMEPLAEPQPGGGRFRLEPVTLVSGAAVWRVAWSVTGAVLASSGDDCVVRLWKLQYQQQWKCVAALRNDKLASGEIAVAGGAGGATGGSGGVTGGVVGGVAGEAPRAHTAYIKMAAIANPSHMPWH